jgi:hypothetical protein
LPIKDYAAWQQLGKTIAQGQSTATFSVKIMGDKITEPNEVFGVRLSNPVGASLADDEGVGIIMNDDSSHLLGAGNNSDVIPSGGSATGAGSAPECQRLKREVANIEAAVVSNRLKETEGVRNILLIETRRNQLGCR